MKEQIAVADFETDAIEPRPDYPPKPVGLALKLPSGRPRYFAWGHPTGNNCTKKEAARVVRDVWRSYSLLFHHGQFDLDVAEAHLQIARPPWHRVHDTMYAAFLHDPNSRELDLKTLAARHCGIEHPERDELREWIITHIPEAKRLKAQWGRFIWRAPAPLAGRYAKRDVSDTWALWRFYGPTLATMRAAYDRERALAPHLAAMSNRGIPCNVGKLHQARDVGEKSVARLERWIRRRLKAPDLDTWAGDQLADAIEDAGLVCEEGWIATKSGKRSTSKENLPLAIEDELLCGALEARSLIEKQLSTFVRPWLVMAEDTGRVYCQWNQVRSAEGSKPFGARTGRLSSSPNMQNVTARARQLTLPRSLKDIAPLALRDCIEAPRGQRIFAEDFSQQELRLLAHFSGGALLSAYQANADLDVHGWAQDLINGDIDGTFARWQIKNIGFGIIYGMGNKRLANTIDTDSGQASLLKRTYLNRMGLRELDRQLKNQDHVVTWGGRICPVEPPKELENGAFMDFRYKLLNTLIQGSAADQTKQAMIDFSEQEPDTLAISVHDELVGFCQTKNVRRMRKLLSECMSGQQGFQLAFPTDGAAGKTWAECK